MAYSNPYTDSSPWSRMASMLGGQLPPAGSPTAFSRMAGSVGSQFPQMPQPVAGRMAGNGMGMQTGYGTPRPPTPQPMPTAPQAPQGPAWNTPGLSSSQGLSSQDLERYKAANSGLTPENAKRWVDYNNWLSSLDDSPGSADTKRIARQQFLDFLLQQQNQAPIDFSGSSEIGDQFSNARQRMLSLLAARGITGGGLEAGAISNLAGAQGKAMGSFYRDALEKRRLEGREDYQRWQAQQQRMLELLLGRNFGEEDKPSFGEQLLGFAGNAVGGFIPGINFGGGGGNATASASPFM